MNRRITDPDGPEFAALFTGVRSSWFRLETLQAYEVDYENSEFADFLRTGRFHREDTSWSDMVAAHVAAGRDLSRVHVIEEPLTDYLRYELAAYELNSAAGEPIRLLPVNADQWPAELPREDFWLFDDAEAWQMRYDDDCRFIEAVEVTDPDVVSAYRDRRDFALAHSISLGDYTSHAV